jgi:hypothetical protein
MRKLRTSVVGVARYSRQTCSIGRSASGSGFGGAFAARVAAAADAVDFAIARPATGFETRGLSPATDFAASGATSRAESRATSFDVPFAFAPGAATTVVRLRLVTADPPAFAAVLVAARASDFWVAERSSDLWVDARSVTPPLRAEDLADPVDCLALVLTVDAMT